MKRTAKSLILSATIILSVLITPCIHAQKNAVTDRIIELGMTDNRTMDHLDVLSNRIGGRLVGSNAYDNAVQWCATKFEEWGLEVWIQGLAILSSFTRCVFRV